MKHPLIQILLAAFAGVIFGLTFNSCKQDPNRYSFTKIYWDDNCKITATVKIFFSDEDTLFAIIKGDAEFYSSKDHSCVLKHKGDTFGFIYPPHLDFNLLNRDYDWYIGKRKINF